jgi:hypothetical protein
MEARDLYVIQRWDAKEAVWHYTDKGLREV